MRLAGIPLTDDDCKALVDLLYRVGRADDLELGSCIDENLERETKLLGLSPAERDTLLGVLDDPPHGVLSELHGVLARDHRERSI